MYLYAQGRRLTRRSARGGPTQSVGVQVGGEGIEEQLELLLETSVSLWEKTEKRLEGLDVSTLTESLSKSQNSTSPQISPDLRRLDGKGRGKPGGGGGEVKSRPMYSTVDDTSEFARVESGNSDSDVASLPRHDDVDDDMHPSSPSRMTKMLMGQIETLQKERDALHEKVKKEMSRTRLADAHLKQLESQLTKYKDSSVQRRYYFKADLSQELDTTVPAAGGVLGGVATKQAPAKVEKSYFQVRYDVPPILKAKETDENDSDPDEAHVKKMDGFKKFEYQDQPSRAFFKKVADSAGAIPPEKVMEWLMSVEPRNPQDAQPLFVLARDLLMRLSEGEIKLQTIQKAKYEKQIDILQARVDSQEALREEDRSRHRKMQEDAKAGFEEELVAQRKRHMEKMEKYVKEVSPLRMKNAVLANTIMKLKKRVGDLEDVTHKEQMLHWNADQRAEAIVILLEDDMIVHRLPDDFPEKCKISEASMVKWCEHFMRFLESKHAGKSTWLQLVCDVFSSTPSTLGQHVARWYHTPDLLEEQMMDQKSKTDLSETPKAMTVLHAMRQDIQSGKRDIWDMAALILQKPKSLAMATLIGFGEEDAPLIQDMWQDFMSYMRNVVEDDLSARDSGDLQRAFQRLENSPIWDTLKVSAHIRRHRLFDLELYDESKPYDIADSVGLVAKMYDLKFKHNDEDGSARQPREHMAFPEFVRHACVQQTGLKSTAQRMQARLLASVKNFHKGHSRIRVFGRLCGMVSPLKYFAPAEAFVLEWIYLVMMLENGDKVRSHLAGEWKEILVTDPSAGNEILVTDPSAAGASSRSDLIPNEGGSGARNPTFLTHSIPGIRISAKMLASHAIKAPIAKNLLAARSLSNQSLTMKAVSEKLYELHPQLDHNRSISGQSRRDAAAGLSVDTADAPEESLSEDKRGASSSGFVSPSRNLNSPSRFVPKEGPGASAPRVKVLKNWMRADRSVLMDNAVEAALIVMNELLVSVPGSERSSEADIRRAFAAARVNVPSGVELSAKDAEKLSFRATEEGEEDLDDDECVSLDLASEVLLDLYLKGIKAVQERVVEFWRAKEEHWDCGVDGKSPDLDHLRLFLAQECKIMLQERDLLSMYIRIATGRDSLDGPAMTKEIFAHASRSKRINHAKMDKSPWGALRGVTRLSSSFNSKSVPSPMGLTTPKTPELIVRAIERGRTSPIRGQDRHGVDESELSELHLDGSDVLTSPLRGNAAEQLAESRYLEDDEDGEDGESSKKWLKADVGSFHSNRGSFRSVLGTMPGSTGSMSVDQPIREEEEMLLE